MTHDKVRIIGVSGPSGSGKSTLAAYLCEKLPNAVIVGADKYYKKELPQMFSCIDPWGQFLMETGEYNADETARLAEKCGFKNISILRDLEGQKRVVTGRR